MQKNVDSMNFAPEKIPTTYLVVSKVVQTLQLPVRPDEDGIPDPSRCYTF